MTLRDLTAAQLGVLELCALGLSNKQIAKFRGCSPSTVQAHLHAVYEKLGVAGRKQACSVYAQREPV